MYRVPQHVKALKACTVNGVTYAKNDVLTAAQLKAIPHLAALLSNGTLAPVPDVHARRIARGGKTATNIPPVVLASITHDYDPGLDFENQEVSVVHAGLMLAALSVVGGQAPYLVDWDDASDPEVVEANRAEHQYAAAGTYHVAVTGSEGDSYPVFDLVIEALPVADFTADPTLLSVDFDSTVTGADSLVWDFGDDSEPDDTADPTHVYAEAGTYTVVLVATNISGDTRVEHEVEVADE